MKLLKYIEQSTLTIVPMGLLLAYPLKLQASWGRSQWGCLVEAPLHRWDTVARQSPENTVPQLGYEQLRYLCL